MENKKVLIVGIDPFLIDFSLPEFGAFPGMTANKVEMGINGAITQLNQKGYIADKCWLDFGTTAGEILERKLTQLDPGIVLIGAGIRVPAATFELFEQLINVVHAHAPKAKICFNTSPADTVMAVERVTNSYSL
ncbi:MAG TPA: SGNH/GDSL hydrolase family protein [Flavobacteriales bacterium]|nr:SGNH/GDSL hydrolase family protein [Flavobacteriales bacterium]